MPVAGKGASNVRSAMLVGIAAVVAAVGLIGLVVTLSGETTPTGEAKVQLQLGDDVFDVGNAKTLARTIAEEGPLGFADPAAGDHPIWLQHEGGDHRVGWYAFEARRPGAAEGCLVQWQSDEGHFTDTCTHEVFPTDGGSLPHFAVTVTSKGHLVVDLGTAP